MHRSHLSVLVIFAAMAACSKRDDSEGRQILSQDRALVAQLELDKDTRRPAQSDACGPITVAAHPFALVNIPWERRLQCTALDCPCS